MSVINGSIDSSNVKRQLDTNPKGTVTSIHGSSFAWAKDILYNYIHWYWSFVDQLNCSFSVCTIANGELLYPLHIASSVCLRKIVLLRHTYTCHTLPAFIHSQTKTQMWCKYLATIQVLLSVPHFVFWTLERITGCFLSLFCSQYLSGHWS